MHAPRTSTVILRLSQGPLGPINRLRIRIEPSASVETNQPTNMSSTSWKERWNKLFIKVNNNPEEEIDSQSIINDLTYPKTGLNMNNRFMSDTLKKEINNDIIKMVINYEKNK